MQVLNTQNIWSKQVLVQFQSFCKLDFNILHTSWWYLIAFEHQKSSFPNSQFHLRKKKIQSQSE